MSLWLTACSEKPVDLEDGTEAMVARLDSIARNVDPMANPYASKARVEFMKQIPEPNSPEENIRYNGTLAQEMVFAGQTESAIEILTPLLHRLETDQKHLAGTYLESLVDLLAFSYLRLAEQQNCLHNHTSASCLFPIQKEGIHTLTEGSEKAMDFYRQISERQPDNMEARWLLNVAAMTLGKHPDEVPRKWLIPKDAFETDESFPRFQDIAPFTGLAEEMSLSGGSVTEDFNKDGLIDIMASSWGLSDQIRYFENSGDGHFVDRTHEAGLTGITGGLNLKHADFDNDGFADVFVLRGAWLGEAGLHPNSLLKNNGDGTFSDVTESAGLMSFHPTQTAVWSDFNNDGWLDLFIGNESYGSSVHSSELYLSSQDGTFRNIAKESGVAVEGYIKGVAAGDFNNDSYPDLYISRFGGYNTLFRNEGPDSNNIPTFTDVTSQAGVSEPVESFPTWFWDYNNDGLQDLFVFGYYATPGDVAREYLEMPHEAEFPRLYRNNGDGTFTDVKSDAGLEKVIYAMGSNFGDLDNDGYLDFYAGTGDPDMRTVIPNRMFRNNSGIEFSEVTTSGGFGHLQKGHGISFADLDNDGDQDIFTVIGGALEGDVYMNALFMNPGNENNWISLEFQGTESNRAGIGSKIVIEAEAPSGLRKIHRTVTTGGSFGSSSLQQEIGLGKISHIDRLQITWPASGRIQHFQNVAVNQTYLVSENSDQLEPVKRTNIQLRTSHHP
ncbi:MAG: CRTAC1 family protein [Balneolaceae bacterium]|nr:CRTAC1 family protein [Balneolaceae bacterium]